jgi:hypothetical protein
MLILPVVIAHWVVAVLHLFLAARVLAAPNNNLSWLAISLITLGHWGVSIALWKLSDKLAALVWLIFFLAALSADLYEHSCMHLQTMFLWSHLVIGLPGST